MSPRRPGVSRFEQRLIARAGLGEEGVERARHRQRIYGGALDTALLELGLTDEALVREVLREDTRLDPLPRALLGRPVVAPEMLLDAASARRTGALVYALQTLGPDGFGPVRELEAIVRQDFDVAGLARTIGDAHATVYVAPEVRFEALWGAFYDVPVPPRFLALLGRLMGPEQARAWAAPKRTARPPIPAPPVDIGPRPARSSEAAAHAPPAPAEPSTPPPGIAAATAPFEAVAAPEPPAPGAATTPRETPERTGAADRADAPTLGALRAAYLDLAGSTRGAAYGRLLVRAFSTERLFDELLAIAREHPDEPADGPAATAWLTLLALPAGPPGTAATPAQAASPERTPAAPFLARLLQHPEGRWRTWAALGLAALPRSALTADMVAALVEQCRRDPDAAARRAAARALREVTEQPALELLREQLRAALAGDDPQSAASAVELLLLRRDLDLLPELIEVLHGRRRPPELRARAREALVALTARDAGPRPAGWRALWRRARGRGRLAWLVGALDSSRPHLRLTAIEELSAATGQRLGYYHDLPRPARLAAQRRWRDWLEEHDQARDTP